MYACSYIYICTYGYHQCSLQLPLQKLLTSNGPRVEDLGQRSDEGACPPWLRRSLLLRMRAGTSAGCISALSLSRLQADQRAKLTRECLDRT